MKCSKYHSMLMFLRGVGRLSAVVIEALLLPIILLLSTNMVSGLLISLPLLLFHSLVNVGDGVTAFLEKG